MKYVMINEIYPVIFSDAISHNEMGRLRMPVGIAEITSAGFTKQGEDGKFYVYGYSESLKLKPSEKDSTIINRIIMDDY